MPASAAQIFGPATLSTNFNTAGEQTLLTMSTTLPAGGKNVIIVSHMIEFVSITSYAQGYFQIKKGVTVLYQTPLTNLVLEHWKPKMHVAVDDTPNGNDVYTYVVVVSNVGNISLRFHLQAIVIKADDVAIAYNTTTVSVTAGQTATVISLNTSYSVGAKVAVVGFLSGAWTNSSGTHVAIGAGTARLKLGTTILSSNEFTVGSNYYQGIHPLSVNLLALATITTSTQTWAVEFNNNTTVNHNFLYASILTFTVSDGAFLDTASVALSNGVQVTVGSLSTTLTGDVVVLAIASADNTTATDVTAFNAGDVVLQKNNSATGQIANQVSWVLQASTATLNSLKSGGLLMVRLDTNVTNPSYQIKMTARASGINGEAKILAFVLSTGLAIKRAFGETVRETEGSIFGRSRFRISAESVNLIELRRVARNLVRIPLEAVNLVESMVRDRIRVRVIGEAERVSEAFRALQSLIRQALEGLSISEAIARSRRRFRSAAENVQLSETISRARIVARVVGEAVRALEATVRSRIIGRVIGEVMHIFEAFNLVKGTVKAIVEGLQLSESIRKVRGLARIVAEQIRITEIISKSVRFVKILAESLNLVEVFRAVRDRFRTVGESLGISELITSFKGAVRVVGEALNLSEVSRVVRNLFRQVSEAINIGEAFARIRIIFRSASESVAILEGRLVSRAVARVADEVVLIGETLVRFKGRALSILESINILESKLFRRVKTYIDRLVSALRGMAVGGEV
jgi:hypothetical protein